MAVDINLTDSATDTSDGTDYSFTNQSIGTADANRVVIVGVGSRKSGAATSISTFTIGGVTADISVEANSTSSATSIAAIGAAVVPTGTTATVVVNFADTMLRCSISVWVMSGGNVTATATDSDITDPDPAVSLNVDADGGVVIYSCAGATGIADLNGFPEDTDGTIEAFRFISGHNEYASAQTPLGITADHTSPQDPIAVAAAFGPSSGTSIPIFQHHYQHNI